MKDYIRIFGKKLYRSSLTYKFIRLVGKTGKITGPLLEPKKIDINKVDISINNLETALNGFKIILLSDIHAGDYIRPKYIDKIVSICNDLEPDIVVIAGDFTETGPEDIYWCAEKLSKIKTNLGIFAVLGNHDIWNGEEEISNALIKNQIIVLRNENKTISINNKEIIIAGVDDFKFGNCDIDKALKNVSPEKTTILISHNPDIIQNLGEYSINLLLCGHIHGGQWRFPIIGPLYIPSKLGKKHAWGLSSSGNTYVYTSKGVGSTSIPFRINCPPEVALITLTSKNV
ncbi:MAG: metallophosphoesterase [Cyanobacteriota bacterium]